MPGLWKGVLAGGVERLGVNCHKQWRNGVTGTLFLVLVGCGGGTDPQEAFWENLQQACGGAFAGRRTVARPVDEILVGTEQLVAHFRECSAEKVKIPFHIELEEAAGGGWDRSRTWVFSRHDDRLELRHDHRKPDGTEDENNWYGGFTETPGTPFIQEFVYHGRQDPEGLRLGWRIEIHPGERYVYGTIRGDEWTWRLEFDLSETVPEPPPPW